MTNVDGIQHVFFLNPLPLTDDQFSHLKSRSFGSSSFPSLYYSTWESFLFFIPRWYMSDTVTWGIPFTKIKAITLDFRFNTWRAWKWSLQSCQQEKAGHTENYFSWTYYRTKAAGRTATRKSEETVSSRKTQLDQPTSQSCWSHTLGRTLWW